MTDEEALKHLDGMLFRVRAVFGFDEADEEAVELAVNVLRERADRQRQKATRQEAARELDILLQSV